MSDQAAKVADAEEEAFVKALESHGLLDDAGKKPDEQEDKQADDLPDGTGNDADDNPPESKKPDPENAEPFEGFNALPEAQRKSVLAAIEERERKAAEKEETAKQYEQRWRAQHGQLAPIQQQAARLLEENRRLQEAVSKGQRPDTDKLEALKARFRETYPEDAEALEAFLTPVYESVQRSREENDRLKQELGSVVQQVTTQRELGALSDAHPDWKEHVPYVDGWIKLLDPVERELAEQWRASQSAQDNIRLLNMYKRDRQLAQLLLAQQQAAPAAGKQETRKPRVDVDPSPRNRQSAVSSPNGTGSEEEDAYTAALERAGIKV